MPTLLARRYGRPGQQVSRTEKAIGGILLVILVGLGTALVYALSVKTETALDVGSPIVAEANQVAAKGATAKTFKLPKLDKGGWTGPESVQSFTPENVHEKIDGRAALYLDYGMAAMTFGTYKQGSDEDRYIDVYVYDMSQTLNAFGCYKAEFAEGMPVLKIGRGGYRAEQSPFFWKGACYVQVMAGDSVSDADWPVVSGLAQQVAERIPDDGAPLWGDDLLPKTNRKPDSLGYERVNGFSLDFLKDIFRADYAEGEAEYSLFIHRAASPDAARKVLDAYAAYLKKHGKVIALKDSPRGKTLEGEAIDMYDVVFCKGCYLGGVNGADNLKLAEKHALAFRDGLKAD